MDIIDSIDTWKRLAGYTQPDGSFVVASVDPEAKLLLAQLIAKVSEQTVVLQGIRARLDGGIRTQAGLISITV